MTETSEYKTLRKRLARRFNDGARMITQWTPRVCLHMEPEAVHDLRVLARRMRALIWVTRRLGPLSCCKRVRRMLSNWGQALGERRSLDVVFEDAAELNINATQLKKRYSEAAGIVRRTITEEGAAELSDLLRKTGKKLPAWSERRLHQGLMLCAQELHKALRDAKQGKEEQHILRIEAKKARYILEALGRKCDPLKQLQGRLGRSHDMEVLQEMLGPHPVAANIEERERALAVGMMREAVHAAEEQLHAAAAPLRGTH